MALPLLALCALASAAAVRLDYYVQTIGSRDGLVQNSVMAVLQDRTGLIWIGTLGGLQRYDGYSLETSEHFGSDPLSAPESPITAMTESENGDLWVGTQHDLLRRDAEGRFHRINLDERRTTADTAVAVRALLLDDRGLWVAGDGSLQQVDPAEGRVLKTWPLTSAQGVLVHPTALARTGDGAIWISSPSGLLRLGAQAGAPEKVGAALERPGDLLIDAEGHLLAGTQKGVYRLGADGATAALVWPERGDKRVTAMAVDARGRLWMAVPREGLAVFDPQRGDTHWLHPGQDLPGQLPNATIARLMVDRSGLLWIGTMERGLARVDPNGAQFQHVLDASPDNRPGAAADNYVRALHQGSDGGLWLGTSAAGFKRYDIDGNRFDSFNDALAQAQPEGNVPLINAFADADGGQLWIGTSRGLVLFDAARRTAKFLDRTAGGNAGESLSGLPVRALLRAHDGSLWIATIGGGLLHYDPASATVVGTWRRDSSATAHGGLGSDNVMTMLEASDGSLWVGTTDGLNRIDPASGAVRLFKADPRDPPSLAGNVIRSLHQTADGTLWIGSHAGLSRLTSLTADNARFAHWTIRDGLPNRSVYAIASGPAGKLWLSTNRGIASFDPVGGSFRSYTLVDGLQDMEFNGGAVAALHDGRLAFGGINGFNLFTPQAIQGSRYAAPVAFTRIRVGRNDPWVPRTNAPIHMTVDDRVVRFEFAALDYTEPARNRFMYQLEGFDRQWVDAGIRHEATYTNLPAGSYRFRVRASNHDGYWTDEATSIPLRVMPPWWQSTTAKMAWTLGALLLALLGWQLWRRRLIERSRYRQRLREREDRLRLALWGSGDEFWDLDIPSGLLTITRSGNPSEYSPGDSRVFPWDAFRNNIHPDDLPLVQHRLDEHVNGNSETYEAEHRYMDRSGEWHWIAARGSIVARDREGRPSRLGGTARDTTARHAAEHDRRIAEEVIRSMGEAVAVTDSDFRFVSVNPAFTRMTGWRREEVAGKSVELLNCPQHPIGHYTAMREAAQEKGHWRGELWQRRKDGDELLCWIEVAEVRDSSDQRTHYVSVITDITDRKRAEQELRYLANYDPLTGLPNRTLLSERLGRAIVQARRSGRKIGVLFLDLDRFKHVNDSMGHAAGDRLLKAAGSRLRQIVRGSDSVARLGGDEFTVVIEGLFDVAEAEGVAAKIISAFEQPLELESGQEVVISPSIGISLYPDHGQVPSDLLKFADTAMYQAKERGRKTWMVYTEAMDAAARLRATMAGALGKALEREEFSLVYQPKLSLLDERITGVEALLRWRSAELGDISPAVFIPLAEETGLIIEIGNWVVAQACAQLARWRDEGIDDITMSVNVSVAQLLRGDLMQRLCDVLAEHDIAPNRLELEITESVVMANAEQSIVTLRRLKSVGVTLAIDDFGTGYSSLSYLKRLPIDTLKIDKEFVGDITTDPDDEAITATVIAMAHSLGLNVVAEGVELAEQVEYLREQDCDEIQGHWLARPLPPRQCLELLRRHAEGRHKALHGA